jgi:hypothetical protein
MQVDLAHAIRRLVFAAGVEALFGEPFLLKLADEVAAKKGNRKGRAAGQEASVPQQQLTAEQRLAALESFEGAFFDFEAGFEVRRGADGV